MSKTATARVFDALHGEPVAGAPVAVAALPPALPHLPHGSAPPTHPLVRVALLVLVWTLPLAQASARLHLVGTCRMHQTVPGPSLQTPCALSEQTTPEHWVANLSVGERRWC